LTQDDKHQSYKPKYDFFFLHKIKNMHALGLVNLEQE